MEDPNKQSSHIIVGLLLILTSLAVYFLTIRPDLLIGGFHTRPVIAEVYEKPSEAQYHHSDYHIQYAENEHKYQWTIGGSEL